MRGTAIPLGWLWVLLASSVVHCGLSPEPARVRIGLYAEFQQPVATAVRDVVHEELAAIATPLGMVVDWRSTADAERDQWRTAVVTVTFRGHCDATEAAPRPSHPWIFGESYVRNGAVVPYGQIHCDPIRASLTPLLRSLDSKSRTAVFGRAVSRVLAHELYHILAKTPIHGSDGIGKSFYSARELAADAFPFREPEIERLRLALQPESPEPAIVDRAAACRLTDFK